MLLNNCKNIDVQKKSQQFGNNLGTTIVIFLVFLVFPVCMNVYIYQCVSGSKTYTISAIL